MNLFFKKKNTRSAVRKGRRRLPSPRELWRRRPSWTMLVIVCMIWGLILGAVNELLADRIAAKALLDPALLVRALPGAERFERVSNPAGSDVDSCYAAYSGDTLLGYVVSTSEKGRNGNSQVQVGVDFSGSIVGTYIDPQKHQETRDIGGDAIESEEFQGQFVGGSEEFVVGENVDAVTFATISSTAVIRAVNRALAAAHALLREA